MLSMSKLLMTSTLLISSLYASSAVDQKVIDFETKMFSKNKRINLKEVSVYYKKELPVKGWYGYVMDVTAEVAGQTITAKDTVFSNGQVVTQEMLDINTGRSLKSMLVPKLSAEYHNQSHLIAGNANAKDKIVIFSDPLCPFCMDYVPDVINHVKRNADSIALYYYHFPLLRIHPAAGVLTKLMDISKHQGMKDVELKVYQADWDKYFTEKTTDAQKIIDGFNKEFKTKITLAQVKDKKVHQAVVADMKMGDNALVEGTPTIFINGEKDSTKLKYETLGKK